MNTIKPEDLKIGMTIKIQDNSRTRAMETNSDVGMIGKVIEVREEEDYGDGCVVCTHVIDFGGENLEHNRKYMKPVFWGTYAKPEFKDLDMITWEQSTWWSKVNRNLFTGEYYSDGTDIICTDKGSEEVYELICE